MGLGGPAPALRALYYDETDRLDFDLYDEQPWRPAVWELLRAARAADVGLAGEPPLLTADEIDAWRARTLGWFDAHRDKADYEPRFITRELVWPFIPRTAAQIAAQLSLSVNPVKVHSRNIYGKLGAHSRTQAVARAQDLGILPST